MKHMPRLVPLAATLLSFGLIASPVAPTTRTAAGPAWLVAVHDQQGIIDASRFPSLLDRGTNGFMATQVVPPRSLGSLAPRLAAAPVQSPAVAWISGVALDDAIASQQAGQLWRAGMPVVVLAHPGDDAIAGKATAVFGVGSPHAVAIYALVDGKARVWSVDIDPADAADADISIATEQAMDGLVAALRKQSRRAAARVTQASDRPDALPFMELENTSYAPSGNGASVTLVGTVIRDVSRSRDVFHVSTKVSANMRPHDNGLSGGTLTIPRKYFVAHRLSLMGTGGESPTLVKQAPKAEVGTTLNVEEKGTTTSAYSVGLTAERSMGLEGKVPNASTKVGFGFNYARTYVDEKSLKFSMQDYANSTSASIPFPGMDQADFSFDLTPAIASSPGYFGNPVSAARITPTMQFAAPETFASWNVEGSFRGMIVLSTVGTIDNLKFNGGSIEQAPDPRWQPTAGLTFNADSPYLTRNTTVFLRSRQGDGGCLFGTNLGQVEMRTCPDTSRDSFVEDKNAQWQLDENNRYVNRGTGKCMKVQQAGQGGGLGSEVVLDNCSLANSQAFQWRADRIHSRYDNASQGWRLFVDSGNALRAITTGSDDLKEQYPDYPVNVFDALLPPWSDYPSRPVAGNFVPNLNGGAQPAIPESYLTLAAVRPHQSWDVVVLRQGLVVRP